MYLMMRRWGRLADSIGNVRVIQFTAPIISIIPLLWLINRHPAFLVGAQLVSGFAWAGFNLSASNFIYDAVASDKRVRYISYFNVLNGIMLSAGALLGGFLASQVPPIMGYRILTILVISSIMRIIVTALFSFRLREVRSVVSIKSDDLFFGMLGIRPFLGVERRTIHIRNN
jgi:MFS family permease